MSPFQASELPREAFDTEYCMKRFGITREEAYQLIAGMATEKIVINDTYQVNGRMIKQGKGFPACDVLWLSIKRRDKETIHDWRELQTIKNLLAGPELEAVEIYPPESRLVDTANQYHLYVFMDPKVRLPFGFNERLVGDEHQAAAVGAKQRPFEWAERKK